MKFCENGKLIGLKILWRLLEENYILIWQSDKTLFITATKIFHICYFCSLSVNATKKRRDDDLSTHLTHLFHRASREILNWRNSYNLWIVVFSRLVRFSALRACRSKCNALIRRIPYCEIFYSPESHRSHIYAI